MATDVILFQDVNNLGTIGEHVTVSDGYARNYLFPRGLAGRATKQALEKVEKRKRELQKEHEERLAVAQSMAEQIKETSVTIAMEANEEEKLYGSVTPRHISDALKENGLEIEAAAVKLDEPLRELGVFTVPVHLHDEVETELKVWVVRS
ncbi:MAG: 50S ribosomal protein L9 [Verrucomicrobiota bacterium]